MKKEQKVLAVIYGLVTIIAVLVIALVISKASCSPTATMDEVPYTTVDEVETVVATTTQVAITTQAPTEAPEPTENNQEHYNNYESYSDYELDLLVRTIYQEGGICSEYCQWLIGSAVLNLADERGGIENVVFDYNTFNVAYVLYDCTPSELSYAVAARVLSGDRDYVVKYFRTDYYHGFGTPYTNVDNVYFSTN